MLCGFDGLGRSQRDGKRNQGGQLNGVQSSRGLHHLLKGLWGGGRVAFGRVAQKTEPVLVPIGPVVEELEESDTDVGRAIGSPFRLITRRVEALPHA